MKGVFPLIIGVVVAGGIYVVAPVVTDTYRRYRGRKTVVCPETGQITEVDLKAAQASLLSALGKRRIRVSRCSLWPRKKDCAEECVESIGKHRGDRTR